MPKTHTHMPKTHPSYAENASVFGQLVPQTGARLGEENCRETSCSFHNQLRFFRGLVKNGSAFVQSFVRTVFKDWHISWCSPPWLPYMASTQITLLQDGPWSLSGSKMELWRSYKWRKINGWPGVLTPILGGGNSNIVYFHPGSLKNDPIWQGYCFKWVGSTTT